MQAASDAPKPRAGCARVGRPLAEQSASVSSSAYVAVETAASSDAPVLRSVAAAVSARREAAAEEPAESGAAEEAAWALVAERHQGAGQDAVRLRAARPLAEPWARPLVALWAFPPDRLRLAPAQRR